MNTSNFFNIRAKYFSSLESIETKNTFGDILPSMDVSSQDIVNSVTDKPWGLSLKFQNVKSFLVYLLGLHALEPVIGVENELVALKNFNIDITLTYDTFMNNATIDLKNTFIFKPIKFSDDMLLSYKDPAYQGERSVYKPFGHTVNKAVDTKATLTLVEVKQFFAQHFKYDVLRGTATFSYGSFLPKGYIIELTGRPLILLITSVSISEKGISTYEALVLIKDS